MERDEVALDQTAAEEAERVSYLRVRRQRRVVLDSVLRAYGIMGLLIAVFAFGYFALSLLHFKLSQQQLFAVVIAGSGVALSVMSWLLLAYRRQISETQAFQLREYAYTSELIDTWLTFENLSRKVLAAQRDGVNKYSLRVIISKLFADGLISGEDLAKLQDALEVRNLVVHGQGHLPPTRMQDIINSLTNIIAKLSKNPLS